MVFLLRQALAAMPRLLQSSLPQSPEQLGLGGWAIMTNYVLFLYREELKIVNENNEKGDWCQGLT